MNASVAFYLIYKNLPFIFISFVFLILHIMNSTKHDKNYNQKDKNLLHIHDSVNHVVD